MSIPAVAVVDASVALKWVLAEPGSDKARALAGWRLHAPALLHLECASALWVRIRDRSLTAAEADRRLAALSEAPVQIHALSDLAQPALRLAALLGHSVYDCAYLAVAERIGAPLITADKRFARAVRTERRLAPLVRTLDEIDVD